MAFGGIRNFRVFLVFFAALLCPLSYAPPGNPDGPWNPDNAHDTATQVLERLSRWVQRDVRHAEITPEHLALYLLRESRHELESLFVALGLNNGERAETLIRTIQDLDTHIFREQPTSALTGDRPTGPPRYNRELLALLQRAQRIAMIDMRSGTPENDRVRPEHLFLAILRDRGFAGRLLTDAGTTPTEVRLQLSATRVQETVASGLQPARGGVGRNATDAQMLRLYTTDFTQRARDGRIPPAIGRQAEIDAVIIALGVIDNPNMPVLRGLAGVGKTAIVEGIALRAVDPNEEVQIIRGVRLLSLNIGSLIAGARYRGEAEERLLACIRALDAMAARGERYILFIDEIHLLCGASANSEGSVGLGELLKDRLARGEIVAIGATTFDEFTRYVERDGAMARRVVPVDVHPPNQAETLAILRSLRSRLETKYGVRIPDAALVAIANWTRRVPNRQQPDVAIQTMHQAASQARYYRLARPLIIRQAEGELDILRGALTNLDRDFDIYESTTAARQRINAQIAALEARIRDMTATWQRSRDLIAEIDPLRTELETARRDLIVATVARDIGRAGTLSARISRIEQVLLPPLTRELDQLQATSQAAATYEMNPRVVAQTMERLYQIPSRDLLETGGAQALALIARLTDNVRGASGAIEVVGDTMLRSLTGVRDQRQPWARLLLAGTRPEPMIQTAQIISEFRTHRDTPVRRFDMSSYSGERGLNEFLGAGVGLVGSQNIPPILDYVRQNPHGVIVLENFQACSQAVRERVIQILSDGQIEHTNSNGTRVINFRNATVILTVAIPATVYSAPPEGRQPLDAAQEAVVRLIGNTGFTDSIEIAHFQPPTEESLMRVAASEIQARNARDLAELRLTLLPVGGSLSYLAQRGTNREGAYVMDGVITREIMNRVARMIAANELSAGDTVIIDVENAPQGGQRLVIRRQTCADDVLPILGRIGT